MNKNEKLEFLADVMDLEVEDLEENMKLDDIEEWDSLSTLTLTVEAKKRWQLNLTTDMIKSFKTVKDVLDFIPEEG